MAPLPELDMAARVTNVLAAEHHAVQAAPVPVARRKRRMSSESFDRNLCTLEQQFSGSPLLVSSLLRFIEPQPSSTELHANDDRMVPSPLNLDSTRTTPKLDCPTAMEANEDGNERKVFLQHNLWQRKLEEALRGANERTRWALTGAILSHDPKHTLNLVCSLTPEQMTAFDEQTLSVVNDLRVRVFERVRQLQSAKGPNAD